MMPYWEPRALRQAKSTVKREHPNTATSFQTGRALEENQIGQKLLRKLKTTPQNELRGLLNKLSRLERSLVRFFLNHDAEDIRVKVATLAVFDPGLLPASTLWTHIINHIEHVESRVLAQAGVSHTVYFEYLGPDRIRLLRRYQNESIDGLIAEFWSLVRQNQSLSNACAKIGIETDSRMRILFDQALLLAGPTIWQFVQEDDFEQAADRTSQKDWVQTLAHAYGYYQSEALNTLLTTPKFMTLLRALAERTSLQTELERENQLIFAWYQKLIAAIRLHDFFSKDSKNARFEFWWNYLPRIVDVEADFENYRIFMNFGDFGIIEFAEVGNAAYVYAHDDFVRFRTLNFSGRRVTNNDLKSRNHAIASMNHHVGWQSAFRRNMDNYLNGIW